LPVVKERRRGEGSSQPNRL